MADSFVKLPKELIDIVVDYLYDDIEALKYCRLVHSSWVLTCRLHIFEHVAFHMLSDLESWVDIFPLVRESPAKQVQSLHLSGLWASLSDECFDPDDFNESLLHHFQSFDGVRILALTAFNIPPSRSPALQFAHFRCSLRTLKLYSPLPVKQSDLLRLICNFPRLDDLAIIQVNCWVEETGEDLDPPQESPSFRGNLQLVGISDPNDHFIARLVDLPGGVNFQSIETQSFRVENYQPLSRLMASCASTLENLKLGYSCDCSTPIRLFPGFVLTGNITGPSYAEVVINLLGHRALRHLSLSIMGEKPFSCRRIEDLISSISSPHMSLIKLTLIFAPYPFMASQLATNDWGSLDDILTNAINCGATKKVAIDVMGGPNNIWQDETLDLVKLALVRLGTKGEAVDFGRTRESWKAGCWLSTF